MPNQVFSEKKKRFYMGGGHKRSASHLNVRLGKHSFDWGQSNKRNSFQINCENEDSYEEDHFTGFGAKLNQPFLNFSTIESNPSINELPQRKNKNNNKQKGFSAIKIFNQNQENICLQQQQPTPQIVILDENEGTQRTCRFKPVCDVAIESSRNFQKKTTKEQSKAAFYEKAVLMGAAFLMRKARV